MSHPRVRAAKASAAYLAAALAAALGAAGCSQEAAAAVYPSADLRPPGLLAAGPTGARDLTLRFDEAVSPVPGSYSTEPEASLSCRSQDKDLVVSFGADQSPGADYALVGEADDAHGNRTRFLVRFIGWNDRAPGLRLSEAQVGKNDSKTRPHRDYLELEVLADGNVGGEEVAWASSVKSAAYRFPGIEVKSGEFIVLHLSPEGIDAEKDELGGDAAASGGIDASPTGRDLWCSAMALPDESGAVAVSLRPGEGPMDGLFYAPESKTGALGEGKLADLVSSLASSGAWPIAGSQAAWEDSFRWKNSSARSMCRQGPTRGPSGWYISAAGGQSPGAANSEASAARAPSASKNSSPKAGPKRAKVRKVKVGPENRAD